MLFGIISVAILVVFGLILIGYFNRLVVRRNRTENAWSQVDVQLKKRYDLVPNLVKTVKGYAKHEKELFENVTEARSSAINANGADEQGKAENMLSQTLKSIFAVAENYPDLKANENFKLLQEELSGIESKIAYARQFYNDAAYAYDNAMETFPNSVVAKLFSFKQISYFEIEEAEKGPVQVDFS